MSRITFTHVNEIVQRNLQGNYGKLAKLQEGLSSGKRITRPSDAPIDTINDMKLRSNIESLGQFDRNGADAKSYLGVVDSSLISANDIFQAVRERALQADNSTYTAQDRVYMAADVRQMLYQMVSIANTTYKGDYIFAGHSIDTPPWTVAQGTEVIDAVDNTGTDATDTFLTAAELNTPIQLWDRSVTDSDTASGNARVSHVVPGSMTIANLTEGTDYTVDYTAGTVTFLTATATAEAAGAGLQVGYEWLRKSEADLSGKVMRQIDQSVTTQLNLTSDEIFGGNAETDAFEAVIRMMQGMHTNSQADIKTGIDEHDGAFKRLLGAEAVNGSRYNQVEVNLGRVQDRNIETTRIQSELEDLDFAKAISDFTLAESVYKASLSSAARVLQPSLIDFV